MCIYNGTELFKEMLSFDGFWFVGFIIFYIVIPAILLFLIGIVIFISDYFEFRQWKKDNKGDV